MFSVARLPKSAAKGHHTAIRLESAHFNVSSLRGDRHMSIGNGIDIRALAEFHTASMGVSLTKLTAIDGEYI